MTLEILVRIKKIYIHLEKQIDHIYGICHTFSWFFSSSMFKLFFVSYSKERGDFIVLVILSAHIERFSVSRMPDLFLDLG